MKASPLFQKDEKSILDVNVTKDPKFLSHIKRSHSVMVIIFSLDCGRGHPMVGQRSQWAIRSAVESMVRSVLARRRTCSCVYRSPRGQLGKDRSPTEQSHA